MKPRARIAAAIAAAVGTSGCATLAASDSHVVRPRCEFVVYNHTPSALEIRVGVGGLWPRAIGALNPGELLTHSVPCAEEAIWVAGIPIPMQVGAPVAFAAVGSTAELVEGDRVDVPLNWP